MIMEAHLGSAALQVGSVGFHVAFQQWRAFCTTGQS